MSGNNEFLNVQELKTGMVITKDIVKNGKLLIREGAIVNDELISRLNKAYFLEKIEVTISEEVIAKSTKEAELQKVEETFKEISTGLKEMFTKLDKTKENKVNDLELSEKLKRTEFN